MSPLRPAGQNLTAVSAVCDKVDFFPRFAQTSAGSVDVAGAGISYRLWDTAGADAPGLLFLHGFGAHQHWWDHVVPFFSDCWRVATMDFGGMGDSDWRRNYTARNFAEEVLAVIAATGLAPATIVAHSFAGNAAMHASVIAPEAMARVIILDSRLMIPGVPEPTAAERAVLSQRPRSYDSQEEILARYRPIPRVGPVDAEIWQHVAGHSVRKIGGKWVWKFDPSLDPHLSDDPLHQLVQASTVPTTFCYGSDSAVVSRAMAETIANAIPTCGPPISIPGADHHFVLEQPLALISLLHSLLETEGTVMSTSPMAEQATLQNRADAMRATGPNQFNANVKGVLE